MEVCSKETDPRPNERPLLQLPKERTFCTGLPWQEKIREPDTSPQPNRTSRYLGPWISLLPRWWTYRWRNSVITIPWLFIRWRFRFLPASQWRFHDQSCSSQCRTTPDLWEPSFLGNPAIPKTHRKSTTDPSPSPHTANPTHASGKSPSSHWCLCQAYTSDCVLWHWFFSLNNRSKYPPCPVLETPLPNVLCWKWADFCSE